MDESCKFIVMKVELKEAYLYSSIKLHQALVAHIRIEASSLGEHI